MPRTLSAEVGINANDKLVLAALVADIAALRAAILVLTAKLDADAGVTDVNYTTLCTPAAATVNA